MVRKPLERGAAAVAPYRRAYGEKAARRARACWLLLAGSEVISACVRRSALSRSGDGRSSARRRRSGSGACGGRLQRRARRARRPTPRRRARDTAPARSAAAAAPRPRCSRLPAARRRPTPARRFRQTARAASCLLAAMKRARCSNARRRVRQQLAALRRARVNAAAHIAATHAPGSPRPAAAQHQLPQLATPRRSSRTMRSCSARGGAAIVDGHPNGTLTRHRFSETP